MSEFGMNPDQALAMAYGINKNAKTLEERIQKWAQIVKVDPGLDSGEIVARATQLASRFSSEGGDPRAPKAKAGPTGPEQLSGPGSGSEPPAGGQYQSAAEIKALYRAGRLSRAEAKKALSQFGYK